MSSVAFVGPEIEENLSLRYLASSLAASGIDSAIVPFNSDTDFANVLSAVLDASPAPLVVGLSLAFQWRAQDFLALAVALRESGYRGHITVGGHFATFATEHILSEFPEIDSVCRQEAELTIVALVRAVASGAPVVGIPGVAARSPALQIVVGAEPALPDLATLPRPDRRGEPAACLGHGIAPLIGSRGCYANCSFCCIAAWHEQSLPGKRYRLREVDAIADEMVALQRERGVDIFVFHDDNFFLPGHQKNRERIAGLAEALEARGIGPYATVVKARPTDVEPEVFRLLKQRLHCIRAYIGIETDADQGLQTLRRWSAARQNRRAIDIIRALDLYTCFNILLFDPDTDLEAIETNIRFLRFAAECPSNFGRVELYAGTPLLARMLAEGRCRGDWMQCDYALASAEVERVFQLAMHCFMPRNFGDGAIANRIMATRFDLEVCRHFHPETFDPAWLEEGRTLSRLLAHSGADGLARIVTHVRGRTSINEDAALLTDVSRDLRRIDNDVETRARSLAHTVMRVLGRGQPLTDLGDLVATSLQTPRGRPSWTITDAPAADGVVA
jgi:anaerobic magnesium-protoporphyrin IX monomethyl ester cyclase